MSKDIDIVVCGTEGTGKTSFIIRYTSNYFVRGYDPTIADSHKKEAWNPRDPKKKIKLILHDTLGRGEDFLAELTLSVLPLADIVLLLYDRSRPEDSLNEVEKVHLPYIRKITDAPITLIGTKDDESKMKICHESRVLSLVGSFGLWGPYITSAKTDRDSSVDEAVEGALIKYQSIVNGMPQERIYIERFDPFNIFKSVWDKIFLPGKKDE